MRGRLARLLCLSCIVCCAIGHRARSAGAAQAARPRAMLLISAPAPLARSLLRLLQPPLQADLDLISVNAFLRASQKSGQRGSLSIATAMRLAPALQMGFGISVRAQPSQDRQHTDLEIVLIAMRPRPRVLAVQRYALPHDRLDGPTAGRIAEDVRRLLRQDTAPRTTDDSGPNLQAKTLPTGPGHRVPPSDSGADEDSGAPVEITVFRRRSPAPAVAAPAASSQWTWQLGLGGGPRLASLSGTAATPPPLHYGEGSHNIFSLGTELRGRYASQSTGSALGAELAAGVAWVPQTVSVGQSTRFTQSWAEQAGAFVSYRWAASPAVALGPELGYRIGRMPVVDGPFPSLTYQSPAIGALVVGAHPDWPIDLQARLAILVYPWRQAEAGRLGQAVGYHPGALGELQIMGKLGAWRLGGQLRADYVGSAFRGLSFIPTPQPFADASLTDVNLQLSVLLGYAL
jgi:hypothetical protein